MYGANESKDRYSKIINLPHHISEKHKRMSMHDRAAQFSPFAALTGYEAEIEETARLTDEKAELDEDEINDLNSKLRFIEEHIDESPEITVEYFIADKKKSGDAYHTLRGTVRRIDEYVKSVVFENGESIPISDICKIESDDFKETMNE